MKGMRRRHGTREGAEKEREQKERERERKGEKDGAGGNLAKESGERGERLPVLLVRQEPGVDPGSNTLPSAPTMQSHARRQT
eukprot:651982-Rhodomonas_salina.1